MRKNGVIHESGRTWSVTFRQRRTEPQPRSNTQKIRWWSINMWFLRYASGQTDRHTDRAIAILGNNVKTIDEWLFWHNERHCYFCWSRRSRVFRPSRMRGWRTMRCTAPPPSVIIAVLASVTAIMLQRLRLTSLVYTMPLSATRASLYKL